MPAWIHALLCVLPRLLEAAERIIATCKDHCDADHPSRADLEHARTHVRQTQERIDSATARAPVPPPPVDETPSSDGNGSPQIG